MDTLEYAKKLQESGFTQEQAEVTISVLNEMANNHLVTSKEMELFRQEMKAEFGLFRLEVKRDMDQRFAKAKEERDRQFAKVKEEMDQRFGEVNEKFHSVDKKFKDLEWTLTKRMAFMFTSAVGVMAALPKIFAFFGW